jgi:hypothetical protein
MNPFKSQWYAIEDIEPPHDTAVLCFNGRTFIGIWDGTTWYASRFETDPNRPPPTHWRELPHFNTDE